MTAPINRRQFVKTAASPSVVLGPAIQASGKAPPRRRVRIGLIGCGGRGRQLLQVMREYPDVEFPVISDVIEPRMQQAAKILGEGPLPGKPDHYPHYKKAFEILRSGRLGKVALVECWNYRNTRNRVAHSGDSDPPPGYDWKRWLGPAPLVPFNRSRLDAAASERLRVAQRVVAVQEVAERRRGP